MRTFFSALVFATLPFAAGFAISKAHAQDGAGLQYSGPGIPMAGAPSMPVANSPLGAGNGDMTRMAQLEQQIRELTNQLEQRDFQIRQLQQNFDKFQADSSARIQALEARGGAAPMEGAQPSAPSEQPYTGPASSETPPSPSPVQNPIEGSLDDANGAFKPSNTPQLGQITEPSAGNPDGAVTSGTPQDAATPASAAKAYDQAFSYLQQSNYQDAQTAFTNFLKTYPAHPLAANAQYWLGETYFAQTQYSAAAKTFAKAFQEHPQGQKAPDALLKLALTLEKMNKKDDACLTLGELNKRFPSGPASVLRRGTEEGARMGCAI